MRWRRILSEVCLVLLVIVCLPFAVVVFFLILLVVLPLVASFALANFAVRAWNNLPRNRRAIERARGELASRLPGRQVRQWHVAQRDRDKCFVRATLTGLTNPRTVWLCAVWDGSGQVDDLGTWQFDHGIDVCHAARAYERSRAAGQPWPKELSQLAEKASEDLRILMRPGLRPHSGSVLVRRGDSFAFYAFANAVSEVLSSEEVGAAEAYDAECRLLRLAFAAPDDRPRVVVLAPFPPAPPEKVFIVRLRHYLMSRADEDTKKRLREMLPAELADYGIRTYDDSTVDGEIE